MNLECLRCIIVDNLAIHIDLTNMWSWNLNTGLSVNSLTKWNNATLSDVNLVDFGLTAFDNGRMNSMNSGITLTQNDNKLILNRIGFNNISGGTFYSGYTITPYTETLVGNYFSLTGGYLQGFFKLENYDYEIFPPRYNKGITIETVLEILPQSEGIFYLMGTRAEDKYNPFFSGETILTGTTNILYGGKYTGSTYEFTGITTSKGNHLVSYNENTVTESAFSRPEYSEAIIQDSVTNDKNIQDNIIAFEITLDKKIRYKYIDGNGNLIQNDSPHSIYRIGWTVIDIVFRPYDVNDYFVF